MFANGIKNIYIYIFQSTQQTNSDDDEPLKGPPEMSCDHAREKLTNSIRQQWRKLKHHVERLDSQGRGYHSQTLRQIEFNLTFLFITIFFFIS